MNSNTPSKQVNDLLAEIALVLMVSGASSSRVMKNTQRIATSLGYKADLFLSLSGAVISVTNLENKESYTLVRTVPHIGVNYRTVSDISILSWDAFQKKLSVEEIREKLERIKKRKHYSKIYIRIFVGLAGAGLCRIIGGTWYEFFVTFLATAIGLAGRQILTQKKFNTFLVVTIASFISVSIVNIFYLMGGIALRNSLITCVLYLIPGVPLINSFIDLSEGYMIQGLARGATGTILVFVIAVGFFLSLFIFGNHGFS